jgi:adenosylcobinamide kinase/adenosylcobinamide-phosphate guanylyltransferase
LITLITGGARSGKSRFALDLAAGSEQRAFIATAEPLDGEMADRIRRHREEREGRFLTVEEPADLAGALARLPASTEVAVVDCLTVWLGNLVHRQGDESFAGELEDLPEAGAFLAALAAPPCALVLVSNEVGMGIIAESPLARRFTDLVGRLNQAVAARAQRVVLMVSGLPLVLKGEPV